MRKSHTKRGELCLSSITNGMTTMKGKASCVRCATCATQRKENVTSATSV